MSLIGGITAGLSSITSGLGISSSQQNFLNQENQLSDQQMAFQLAQQQEQNSFSDTTQIASNKAKEGAQLQTFAQDIENARNTLSSSDFQQIK